MWGRGLATSDGDCPRNGYPFKRDDDVWSRGDACGESGASDAVKGSAGSDRGFTAFICWTFQPENTVLKAEKAGSHEYLRMQALARIFLDNIPNLQSSWVTQGPAMGQVALKFGANDFGSLMMEENVVSSAGTSFRLTLDEMRRLIREAGYEPRQRNNEYQLVEPTRPELVA